MPSASRRITFDFDVVGGFRFDGVADDAVIAVEGGGDRDVGDVHRIGGVEPDVPVDSCVIEEVVPVALPFADRRVLDDARWDRLPRSVLLISAVMRTSCPAAT